MNRKILCVDDEEAILKGFRLHLRKDYELFTANCGEEGLTVFEQESPFAVVLSVWLGLNQAGSILGDMAAVYFVSVAAIVAAFYGKEAIAAKRNDSIQVKKSR